MSEKQSVDTINLPEGRLINESLFVKDKFNDQAVAQYKVEVACPDDDAIDDLYQLLCNLADAEWGPGAGDDPNLRLPLLTGDRLAKKRVKKGKDGAAYEGKTVIRASTIYNKHGDDDAGGCSVYDEAVEEITASNKSAIYPGCYVIVGVNVKFYSGEDTRRDADGDEEAYEYNGIGFYLQAVQKVGDGERLASGSDKSTLFKPVNKKSPAGGETGRRQRRTRD